MKYVQIIALTLAAATLGCGDSDNEGSGGGGGGPPSGSVENCRNAGDCPAEHVCLRSGDGQAGCVPTCSGSVNECGAQSRCGGVGVLDVDVCQDAPKAEEKPKAEEQLKVPCTVDADCQHLNPVAICAEWRGALDCTLPCDNEETCDPPPIGGLTVNFLDCEDDERVDKTRTACLPREECFSNLASCVSGGGIPGGIPGVPDGGIPGIPGVPGF